MCFRPNTYSPTISAQVMMHNKRKTFIASLKRLNRTIPAMTGIGNEQPATIAVTGNCMCVLFAQLVRRSAQWRARKLFFPEYPLHHIVAGTVDTDQDKSRRPVILGGIIVPDSDGSPLRENFVKNISAEISPLDSWSTGYCLKFWMYFTAWSKVMR